MKHPAEARTCLVFTLALFFQAITLFAQDLSQQVTIRRTHYGVPHIKADDLKSAAFGLAYAQMEDRGNKVLEYMAVSKGETARHLGKEHLDTDFRTQLLRFYSEKGFETIDQDTRDMLEGFASGINFYLAQYPDRFPDYMNQDYTGFDVYVLSNFHLIPEPGDYQAFLKKLGEKQPENPDVGSNAWALGPSRSKSGNAMLLRNPHLSWDAGYYEAHITVPGKLNFYGDFRTYGLFGVICGFNEYLGWTTTNNKPDLAEVYALRADPEKPDHYVLDGESHPILKKSMTLAFKNGEGTGLEQKEWLFTEHGPVIERRHGFVYIVKSGGWGQSNRSNQLMSMMKARTFEAWQDAMKQRQITASNYTYADREGNIYYLWNASTPKIPHAYQGDTIAHEVTSRKEIWQELQDFDQLPQLKNPEGGYLQNANDPFYFTNLNEVHDTIDIPGNYPRPRLGLRSQHSLSLVATDQKLSLEEMIQAKHSMKLLLADRIKDDLIAAIDKSNPSDTLREVAEYLRAWDNTTAADSRGSALFMASVYTFVGQVGLDNLFLIPWDFSQPMTTPNRLKHPEKMVRILEETVRDFYETYGTYKIAWGDIHRVRHGSVDAPIGGGAGGPGNFRVFWFDKPDKEGRRAVAGGDGWVLAVEMGKEIKAYSILAYGQSNDPKSPHYDDQALMFARNQMKPVAFYERDIEKQLLREYKPGEE